MPLPLLLLVTAIVGCGGGTGTSSEGNGTGLDVASASLIGIDDLPIEAETTEPLLVGSCDPLQILDSGESVAAKSEMIAVGSVKLQEAVGVFNAAGPASDAYDRLTERDRLRCIGEAIASQRDVSVVVRRSANDVKAGDEAEAFVFDVRQLDSGQRTAIEVASVRLGKSVASLILLNTTEAPVSNLTQTVVEVAAAQLR